MTNHLEINPVTGLLDPVNYQPSPHQDERPSSHSIDMIVIHGISLPPGEFGSAAIRDFFCGELDFNSHPSFSDIAGLRVSAHLLIRRTGEIIQFVPFTRRAWHAGESSFEGKTRCNDFSIGIELEGTDYLPYDQNQYQQLNKVIALLKNAYPSITDNRIVGHVDIAPARKTDPGPSFEWDLIRGKFA